MKIIFFGYWGANEGLSQATINPHLEILSQFDEIEEIFYVTIERSKSTNFDLPNDPLQKITHLPHYSISKNRLITKIRDFFMVSLLLIKITKQKNIGLLMCRSSLAGSIGYIVHKISRIPYTVESFEPHADYMSTLNIWKTNSISYILQKYLEKKQMLTAAAIMPVSEQFTKTIKPNTLGTTYVMPCAVDIDKFAFSIEGRASIRHKLGVGENVIIGIYVGKFEGLYLGNDAFNIFRKAFEHFSSFFLIILTPHKKAFINDKLKLSGINKKKVFSTLVNHEMVKDYLSAADFAFSLHKPTRVSYALSPIKNGEYWANGLSIVSTPSIGDDSKIIENEKAGLTIKNDNQIDWNSLLQGIEAHKNGAGTQYLSIKYRNFFRTQNVYKSILKKIIPDN